MSDGDRIRLDAKDEHVFVEFTEEEVRIEGCESKRPLVLKWPEAQQLAAEILRRPGEWWLGDRVGTEWEAKDGKCWPGCRRKLIGGRLCSVIGVAVQDGDPCYIYEAQQRANLVRQLPEVAAKLEYAIEQCKKNPKAKEPSIIDPTMDDAILLREGASFLKGPSGR